MNELLAELMADRPVKRPVTVEAWNKTLWVWRLDTAELLRISKMPRKTNEEIAAYSVEICVAGVGTEEAVGCFDCAAGREWLSRQGEAMLLLAKAVQDFNELTGPSDERKKKSATMQTSDAASSYAGASGSSTPDDCLTG
jgi:hypothetical protein